MSKGNFYVVFSWVVKVVLLLWELFAVIYKVDVFFLLSFGVFIFLYLFKRMELGVRKGFSM